MQKQEVNTKKSRLIDIQIATIAILCLGYWMHEVYATPIHKEVKTEKEIVYTIYDEPSEAIDRFEIYKEPIETSVLKNEPQSKTEEMIKPKVVDDNTKIHEIKKEPSKETVIKTKETTKGKETKITLDRVSKKGKTNIISKKASNTLTPYRKNAVDMFPIHPDCTKFSNNEDILKCFESKIQRLIKRKFDSDLGSDLGLEGQQRIHVYFEIDKNGNISNIKTRGKHKALQNEALRVAKLLPRMSPAMKAGKKVTMSYVIPITLDIK